MSSLQILVPIAYAPASKSSPNSDETTTVPIAYAPERKTPPSVRFLTNGAHRARDREPRQLIAEVSADLPRPRPRPFTGSIN